MSVLSARVLETTPTAALAVVLMLQPRQRGILIGPVTSRIVSDQFCSLLSLTAEISVAAFSYTKLYHDNCVFYSL